MKQSIYRLVVSHDGHFHPTLRPGDRVERLEYPPKSQHEAFTDWYHAVQTRWGQQCVITCTLEADKELPIPVRKDQIRVTPGGYRLKVISVDDDEVWVRPEDPSWLGGNEGNYKRRTLSLSTVETWEIAP